MGPRLTDRQSRFAREVGTTTLGVLIALILGAVATEIGWRIETFGARDALAEELGEIVGQARERDRADACTEAKLDAIGAILTSAEQTGRLPPIGRIGNPMTRTWSRGVWDSTQAAETASHFDREQLDNLSGAYEYVHRIDRWTQEELEAWTRLYAIVGPGRAITPDEIATLRSALAQARSAHRFILGSGIRLDQMVQAFALPFSADAAADFKTTSNASTCGPIAAPDGRGYGEAPQLGGAAAIRANPITNDNPGVPRR